LKSANLRGKGAKGRVKVQAARFESWNIEGIFIRARFYFTNILSKSQSTFLYYKRNLYSLLKYYIWALQRWMRNIRGIGKKKANRDVGVHHIYNG
jgi:hypothetical protein